MRAWESPPMKPARPTFAAVIEWDGRARALLRQAPRAQSAGRENQLALSQVNAQLR